MQHDELHAFNPDDALILSSAPLPETGETVTFAISADGDEPTRLVGPTPKADLLEEKILRIDGKITFNPKSFRLFSIPAIASTPARPIVGVDRSEWDLYLVWMPFTLHETSSYNAFYEQVIFFVELETPDALAFDLFPRSVSTKIEETQSYTLSPQIKFQDVEINMGQIQRELRFERLHPTIRAYGEGESKFYWKYTKFEGSRGVVAETKHALVILQVPRGTQSVTGQIHYEVILQRNRLGRWKSKERNLIPYPIHWDLSSVPPLYVEDTVVATQVTQVVPDTQKTTQAVPAATSAVSLPAPKATDLFDVCVVCALAEEAEAFIAETTTLCNVTFQEAFSKSNNKVYRHATITNKRGEDLSISVACLPDYGPLETGLYLKPVLEEFRPRFAAMTGICAGDRRKVALGDIIVAERAFHYDTGKIMVGDDGQPTHLRDTNTQHPGSDVLQFVRMFTEWQPTIAPRPISLRQQREWLLNKLLDQATPRVNAIPQHDLELYAPDWREIVAALQRGPQPYLTADGALRDRASAPAYPFKDPAQATVYIATMASGSAVRADNPFDEIRVSARGSIAVDMEGAAFYRTVADFTGIRALLVKGVSDYADQDKDDSYHEYASRVSANYMLHFIRTYVTTDAMPRSTR